MRVAGVVLGGLLCGLAGLLLTRGWWGAPGAEGLAPLRAPAEGSELEGVRAAERSARGLESGAAVGVESLRVTASRLPGRCVSHLGDQGIPGVLLEFFAAEQRLAAERSDELGEFLVELGQHAADRVEVSPPPGWWVVEQGLEAERYLVRLAPSDVGPLRARLVDRSTGEAAAEYVVQLRDEEGWAETVKTDGNGELRTRVLLKRGAVTLFSTAEETTELPVGYALAIHQHEPSGASPPLAIIAIPLGPTYRLLLEKPEQLPLSRLRAFLTPADWLEEVLDEMEGSANVHAGNPPWVRFVGDSSWFRDARLVVCDANGRWRGVAAVDPGPGLHPDPVPIRMERMARVVGTVVDAEGAGVAGADVELRSSLASRSSIPRLATSNGLGNFLLEGVSPGTYEVSVRHATRGACEGLIHVRHGEEERHRLQLEPYLVAGDVSGAIRSKSGTFRELTSLFLQLEEQVEGEYVSPRFSRVHWEEEAGEYVGRFEFAGVAEGRWLLSAAVHSAPHAVTPAEVAVEAPMSDLEFLVEDDREVWTLGMNVVDQADGRWISEARLRVTDGQGEVLYDGRPNGWPQKGKKWAEDAVLLWEVRAPGYFTERGDRRAFTRTVGGDWQIAVVKLRRD